MMFDAFTGWVEDRAMLFRCDRMPPPSQDHPFAAEPPPDRARLWGMWTRLAGLARSTSELRCAGA